MANDPAGKSSKSKSPPAATPATDAAGKVAPADAATTSSPLAAGKKKAATGAKVTAKSAAKASAGATPAPAEAPVGSAAGAGDSVGAAATPVASPAAQPVTLAVGQPVLTTTAALQVAGLTKPGIYTFSLTVEDDLGAVSKPATITVTIPER